MMFCGYCGTELPDDAEFCSNCGKPVITRDNAPTPDAVDAQPAEASSAAVAAPTAVETPPRRPAKARSSKKWLIPAVAGVVVIAVASAIAVTSISAARRRAEKAEEEARMISQMEEKIYTLTSAADYDEESILSAYDEYEALTDTQKAKLSNRQLIISAYQEIQARIEQRKADAANVDSIIAAIDYSNKFAEASTVKTAVRAYNALSEQAKPYVTALGTLNDAYNAVSAGPLTVTADNFTQAFTIQFRVGENTNYGGETTYFDGYSGSTNMIGITEITPQYNTYYHNDYATPVYVLVCPRYSNLSGSCSFHIDLHQTYTGLTDGEAHEFKLQSADIEYDSSIGAGEYQILVEDNDASGSLLSLFGWSMDFNDSLHQMNDFDVSRVKLSDISGYIQY